MEFVLTCIQARTVFNFSRMNLTAGRNSGLHRPRMLSWSDSDQQVRRVQLWNYNVANSKSWNTLPRRNWTFHHLQSKQNERVCSLFRIKSHSCCSKSIWIISPNSLIICNLFRSLLKPWGQNSFLNFTSPNSIPKKPFGSTSKRMKCAGKKAPKLDRICRQWTSISCPSKHAKFGNVVQWKTITTLRSRWK